jgi:hypothetical protein
VAESDLAHCHSASNYGGQSVLTADDKSDLKRLHQLVVRVVLTQINGTPIKLVKAFHHQGFAGESRCRRSDAAVPSRCQGPRISPRSEHCHLELKNGEGVLASSTIARRRSCRRASPLPTVRPGSPMMPTFRRRFLQAPACIPLQRDPRPYGSSSAKRAEQRQNSCRGARVCAVAENDGE